MSRLIPLPPHKHSPPIREGSPCLCNPARLRPERVMLALRPADVTCGNCWLEMLRRKMVTIDDVPEAIDIRLSRSFLLELGLPVAPLVIGGRNRPTTMTREAHMAARKRIPIAEVRRMLAEKRRA